MFLVLLVVPRVRHFSFLAGVFVLISSSQLENELRSLRAVFAEICCNFQESLWLPLPEARVCVQFGWTIVRFYAVCAKTHSEFQNQQLVAQYEYTRTEGGLYAHTHNDLI